MVTFVKVMLFLWQLPQNLVGVFLTLFYKKEKTLEYKGKNIRICSNFPGGISLGDYVFVSKYPHDKYTWDTVKHEWGHTRQSLFLGPLYLLAIGIPSILWAAFYEYDPKQPNKYYTFYTEASADKLGGVVRT